MTWRLSFLVPADRLPPFEDALAGAALSVSAFEAGEAGAWQVDALFAAEPQRAFWQTRIAAVAQLAAMPVPAFHIERLADIDWVTESLKRLPPVVAGRFHLHCRHERGCPAPGAWLLQIDAARAFGTGHHETTKGCLLALDGLARRWRPARALDLGCGTGVLAIAIARAWAVPVIASDIDPLAVAALRTNVRINGVSTLIRGVVANGPNHRAIVAGAPFDLVAANILARPLQRFAVSVARITAGSGYVLLSGLLKKQERQVLNTYRSCGFQLRRRVTLGDWPTLLMQRDPEAKTNRL